MDLLPLPSESRVGYEAEIQAKELKRLHEQLRGHIAKANAAHKARANKHRKQLEFKPWESCLAPLKKGEVFIHEE